MWSYIAAPGCGWGDAAFARLVAAQAADLGYRVLIVDARLSSDASVTEVMAALRNAN